MIFWIILKYFSRYYFQILLRLMPLPHTNEITSFPPAQPIFTATAKIGFTSASNRARFSIFYVTVYRNVLQCFLYFNSSVNQPNCMYTVCVCVKKKAVWLNLAVLLTSLRILLYHWLIGTKNNNCYNYINK